MPVPTGCAITCSSAARWPRGMPAPTGCAITCSGAARWPGGMPAPTGCAITCSGAARWSGGTLTPLLVAANPASIGYLNSKKFVQLIEEEVNDHNGAGCGAGLVPKCYGGRCSTLPGFALEIRSPRYDRPTARACFLVKRAADELAGKIAGARTQTCPGHRTWPG